MANVELQFDTSKSCCDEWEKYIQHWTGNTATVGIVLSTKHYKQVGKSPLEMRIMDFAGQDEFVSLLLYLPLSSPSDTSPHSSIS